MTMKAGKFCTSMRQIASMPSSAYSTTSTFLMQCSARFAAAPLVQAGPGKFCRPPADRGEVETAVPLARLAHLRRAIALGDRDHGAARCLEGVDKRVHPSSRGGTEGAGRIAFGRLRRAGVIDRMILEIVRQSLPFLEPLAELGMGELARHDHRAGERQPRLDRIAGKRRQNVLHGPAEVDLDDLAAELCAVEVWQILRRIVLQLFEENAVPRDLAHGLAIS